MFEGFRLEMVETPEAVLRVRHGGSGPPLLLLHGNPETHVMWHRVAPALAERFTVVAADLRGYGDSSKPETTADHEPYSKRAMARDQVALMRRLGFERFMVAGHDRGGRCAYRMALDHPERVTRLAVLDILPTAEHFRRTDMTFAMGYWHWFFLAQRHPGPENMIRADIEPWFDFHTSREPKPADFFLAQPFDFPERLIGADPATFLERRPQDFWSEEARADYRRCFENPATIHAICEDYRAGATYDRLLDEQDHAAGRRIACPLLVLWGAKGQVGQWYDVLRIWRDWASGPVTGEALPSGHFLPEEAPEETLRALLGFFDGAETA